MKKTGSKKSRDTVPLSIMSEWQLCGAEIQWRPQKLSALGLRWSDFISKTGMALWDNFRQINMRIVKIRQKLVEQKQIFGYGLWKRHQLNCTCQISILKRNSKLRQFSLKWWAICSNPPENKGTAPFFAPVPLNFFGFRKFALHFDENCLAKPYLFSR